MKQPRVRLLYDRCVPSDHIEATFQGVRSLERFGVLVDRAAVIERAAVKPVKLGRYLRQIIEERNSHPLDFKCWWIRLSDAFAIFPKDILGFGLLEEQLFITDKQGKTEETVGVGRKEDLALLSLFRFRGILSTQLRLRAIEVAAKHEAGHLFKQGHCTEPNCVMQPKPVISKDGLVESILTRGDFCRECETQIQTNVNLRHYELSHYSGLG